MNDNMPPDTSIRDIAPVTSMKVDYSVDALIKEAAELSRFAARHWLADENRPGLSDTGNRFSESFIPHLNSLIESLKEVQANYAGLVTDPVPSETLHMARNLLMELSHFVRWYEETEESNLTILQSIARVAAANINDLDSPHALAYSLYNYASVAKDILDINGPAGGIDEQTANDAFDTVSRLIDAGRTKSTASEDVLSLAALRRKLSYLLQKDVNHLRSSIRFIFRHHPSIVRESEGIDTNSHRVPSFQSYRNTLRYMIRRSKNHGHLPHRVRTTEPV